MVGGAYVVVDKVRVARLRAVPDNYRWPEGVVGVVVFLVGVGVITKGVLRPDGSKGYKSLKKRFIISTNALVLMKLDFDSPFGQNSA